MRTCSSCPEKKRVGQYCVRVVHCPSACLLNWCKQNWQVGSSSPVRRRTVSSPPFSGNKGKRKHEGNKMVPTPLQRQKPLQKQCSAHLGFQLNHNGPERR
eukprot:m.128931 g.128931  ORF g.128931 m.128931 type:complete len:100 (+) comp52300_c0_seq4:385-684(+)